MVNESERDVGFIFTFCTSSDWPFQTTKIKE